MKTFRNKIVQLNLFKHPINDEYGRRTEILTTRAYIILLTGSLVILAFYTLIIEHTETVQVRKPSISIYRRLIAQQEATLSCPCTEITASYASFISVTPVSHHGGEYISIFEAIRLLIVCLFPTQTKYR
jgi:hypothetical protein